MSSTLQGGTMRVGLREDAGLIGLVGLAHLVSHFAQLLLPPLFPWLREAFHVGYTQLGFLMTVFFVVSCSVQASVGFLVDRHGPRPVLRPASPWWRPPSSATRRVRDTGRCSCAPCWRASAMACSTRSTTPCSIGR